MTVKINVSIKDLFRSYPEIYQATAYATNKKDDLFMQVPERGFHHIWEAQFETTEEDGLPWVITWAWCLGGHSNGCKYTIAVATQRQECGYVHRTGWAVGYKDYVFERPLPDEALKALKFAEVKPLLFIWDVPKFEHTRNEPLNAVHFYDNGHLDINCGYRWYTTTKFTMELPPMPCLGNIKAYTFKEGVYVLFENGDFRLMPKVDYFDFGQKPKPDYKYGYLFYIWRVDDEDIPEEWMARELELPYHLPKKHKIVSAEAAYTTALGLDEYIPFIIEGPARLEYSKYETLELPEGRYLMRYVPGTSQPFIETRKFL